MEKQEFIELVKLFLQNQEDIESDGSYVTFSNGELNYALTLKISEEGALLCQEDGDDVAVPALEWVVTRLARFDVLAKAVEEYAEKQLDNYIPISSHVICDDKKTECSDTVQELYSRINSADRFCTSVYYITAEAGEGKSVAVYELARRAAKAYRSHIQKWLFVPVELGGRPFMRLDEMILGMLSKCYRYNSCYLESFMELVKRGYVVLGLDGFEEMAVPGTEGDIVSSLGMMLNDLDSRGQLVFSARTAYYNYSQMRSRSLFQGISGQCDAVFYEFQLNKWTEAQFVSLMVSYGFDDDEARESRRRFEDALGSDHPVLSRAVLAHSLIKDLCASKGAGCAVAVTDAIECFRNTNGHEAVARFVARLVRRETGKWISKNQAATPILSEQEHMHLLMVVADEMWRADSESLRDDTLMAVTELVCEELGKSPSLINQCKERIIDHAMLSPEQIRFKRFCHIDFMQFFLGYSFAMRILSGEEMHRIIVDMDRKILPVVALSECCREIIVHCRAKHVVAELMELVKGAPKVSCLSQNVASLLLLLHGQLKDGLVLKNLYCSRAVLDLANLSNIEFDGCCLEMFENQTLKGGVKFVNCDIPVFYMLPHSNLDGVSFDDKSLPSLLKRSCDGALPDCTDPKVIATLLKRAGAEVGIDGGIVGDDFPTEEDDKVSLFYKVIYSFKGRTYISENLLKTKLGVNFSLFESDLRRLMVGNGVLSECPARDGSRQSVFKMIRPIQEVEDWRVRCLGRFEGLKELLRK